MIYLFSFIFLGAVIVWIYSITVDWTINITNIKRRGYKLFGYSLLTGLIAMVLDFLFCRF